MGDTLKLSPNEIYINTEINLGNSTHPFNDIYSNGVARLDSVIVNKVILADGTQSNPSVSWDNNFGLFLQDKGQIDFISYGVRVGYWYYDGLGTISGKKFELGGKVFLYDDDDDVGAQRRGTNPQEWRIYNTYSSISNYERLTTKWQGNTLVITTEANGTGTLRDIYLKNLKSTTGSGSAELGNNCPADNLREPEEWIQVEAKDGTPRYIPAWK